MCVVVVVAVVVVVVVVVVVAVAVAVVDVVVVVAVVELANSLINYCNDLDCFRIFYLLMISSECHRNVMLYLRLLIVT